MARGLFQKIITDIITVELNAEDRNVPVALEDIEITVYQGGTYDTTPVESTIYRNPTGGTQGPTTESGATGTNPFNTSSLGLAEFYVEPGFYDIALHDTVIPARIADRVIKYYPIVPGDDIPASLITNGSIGDTQLENDSIKYSKHAKNADGLAVGSFHAYRNSSLSGLNSGNEILLDSEIWDESGWFNVVNGRFTPLIAGVYRLSWRIEYSGINAGLSARADLARSGSTILRGSKAMPIANVSVGSGLVRMNGSTNYLSLFVNSENNGLAIEVGSALAFLTGELVGRIS